MNKQKWQFELGILELVIDLNMMQESQFYVTTSHMHVGLGNCCLKKKNQRNPNFDIILPSFVLLNCDLQKKKPKFLEQIMDLLWDTSFVCSFFATYSK